MDIEPPTHARVDAIASAICEAGRSRSRSEESPNAVETIPVEEDGVDALMREAEGISLAASTADGRAGRRQKQRFRRLKVP